MRVLFALSLLFAGVSFADETAETAQEQKVVVKKVLPENQEEEVVAQEDVQEVQE